MVDVRDAEVERSDEDEFRGRDAGEKVDGDDGGAEDHFFRYGSLKGVSASKES